jgi:hypothetical protein
MDNIEPAEWNGILHDARKCKISVFKPPADEEAYAENNPRGCLQQPGQHMCLRVGVVPGEACMLREVAAFKLDHGGFSGAYDHARRTSPPIFQYQRNTPQGL